MIGPEQNNTLYIKYVYDFIWNSPEKLFELITGAPTDTVVIATQAISFLYTLGFDYFQDGIKLGGDSIDLVMFGLGGVGKPCLCAQILLPMPILRHATCLQKHFNKP